jgi:hypothetical protein
MPINQDTKRNITGYLLLGLFLYVAYLPLSSCWFAVKNDALTVNFPPKYFFSAALRSGHWPIWDPYINFGLPLYADPGFAFWQPLTWLFGAIGYTVHTLALEILVYIWLGGIFMYRLGLYLGHSRQTAFLLGLMYMCCGFFIGNLSHTNFLTSAAFLPLVTKCFLQLQTAFSPRRLFFCAISLYLLIAGGHPAIPIATIYFLAALLTGLAFSSRTGFIRRSLAGAGRTNLLLLLAVLGLTAPILLSWWEIWPWFSRSAPVHQSLQQGLGFNPPSYSSFFFPFATTFPSAFFGSDPSMRNGYFSFIGLALFIMALLGKKNRIQKVFLFSGAVMLLLSLGGHIKEALYSHLPLLQYIRINGEYRVFTLLSFLIVLSWPLNSLLAAERPPLRFHRIITALAILCLLTVAGSLIFLQPFRFPSSAPGLTMVRTTSAPGLTNQIKLVLDTLPATYRLGINAVILLLLLAAWFLLRNKVSPRRLLPGLIMADLVLFCWLCLPITGVQRASPADIDRYFSSVPPGIPLPSLSPLSANRWPGGPTERIIGSWSYYSKQPGTPSPGNYPTLFLNTAAYFQSHWPDSLAHKPFLFMLHTNALPSITGFSPTQIAGDVSTTTANDTLVLLQNDFPGWETLLDGRPCPHYRKYFSFIGIALSPGTHHFLYRFEDRRLPGYMLTGLLTFLLLALWARVSSAPVIASNTSSRIHC